MKQIIQDFCYRPEIDGLRALAVIVVVLFHCGLGVPGGYVGVDIFFVISGFLIASLILKDLQNKSFSIVHFWERRARRILPASLVMVCVTMIAGWFLLLPTDFRDAGQSAMSQAIFAPNLYFLFNTSYFSGSADAQPLLHTWSLGVEEQFYMVVPFLLMLLCRFRRTSSRTVLLLSLGLGFVLSFAMSVLLLSRMPDAVFYLLPTRAWELLCGSLVALIPIGWMSSRAVVREAGVAVGVAGMVLPCLLYSKETAFPGVAALPPCLGASIFILNCGGLQKSNLPMLARPFALRPVVFIGLISYSLYLWHWPLVAYSNYWALQEFSLGYRWMLVAASVVLAILSWRFVETPFRTRRWGASRRGMFSYAGTGLAAVAAVGLVLMLLQGFPSRFSDKVIAIDQVRTEAEPRNRITNPVGLSDAQNGVFPRLGASEPAPVELLVWGDSHARAILPAVVAAAVNQGAAVLTAWHPSTPPVLDYELDPYKAKYSLGQSSDEWSAAIVEQVQNQRIPRVLIAARWSSYLASEHDARFTDALVKTVHSLREAGADVWILREIPNHATNVPMALIQFEVFGVDITPFVSDEKDYARHNQPFDALQEELESAGARIVDASQLLLDTERNQFRMELDGLSLYVDDHHLSRRGAALLAPALEPVFNQPDRAARHGKNP